MMFNLTAIFYEWAAHEGDSALAHWLRFLIGWSDTLGVARLVLHVQLGIGYAMIIIQMIIIIIHLDFPKISLFHKNTFALTRTYV